MSLMETYWSTVGDWEQAKPWDGTNGPANEWEYVKFLRGLGNEAYHKGTGQLKRPSDFAAGPLQDRAQAAWDDRGGNVLQQFGEQGADYLKTRFAELPGKFEDAFSFDPLKEKMSGELQPGETRTPGTELRQYLFSKWF